MSEHAMKLAYDAPSQTTVLVGYKHQRGHWEIATKDALGEWRQGTVGGDRIPTPDFYCDLPAWPWDLWEPKP